MLPEVEREIRGAISLKAKYAEAEAELRAVSRRIAMSGGVLVNREALIDLRSRHDTTAAGLKEAIESIERYGCFVKDLDIGLIDFPAYFRGEEVYLCWKLGEPGIGFWHGVEEGFRGRKKVDQDFLENHEGDAPN